MPHFMLTSRGRGWRRRRSRYCEILGRRSQFFSNQIQAELFEFRHTIGSLRLMRRTDVAYIVYDDRRTAGDRTVEVMRGSVEMARAALERWSENDSSQKAATDAKTE
jgi:hypothetical protein